MLMWRVMQITKTKENGQRISMLDGIRAIVPRAQVTFNDGTDIPSAVAVAKAADVVILGLGENRGESRRGHSIVRIWICRQSGAVA